VADTGAGLRDLMARMGHDSARGNVNAYLRRPGPSGPRRCGRSRRKATREGLTGMSGWHVCGTTVVGELIWPTMPPGCPCCDLGFLPGAGEGNRTIMTSLEGVPDIVVMGSDLGVRAAAGSRS
jgi:hypothetical protein